MQNDGRNSISGEAPARVDGEAGPPRAQSEARDSISGKVPARVDGEAGPPRAQSEARSSVRTSMPSAISGEAPARVDGEAGPPRAQSEVRDSISGKVPARVDGEGGTRRAAHEGRRTIASKRAGRPELGRRGERLVAGYLEARGFRILARNARQGHLEIDLIAQHGNLIVFCEVRSRSDDRFVSPAHSITHVKIARLRQAAAGWLRGAKLGWVDVRFDAACVVFDVPEGRLTYYEAAFR